MNKLTISPHRLLPDNERLRVALFLLLTISIVAVSLTFFILSINNPYMGIVISQNDQDWEVTSVDSNGLASQAGLREGDNPIEINGQSAPIFLEKYENAGSVIGVLIKDISVIDENGEIKSVTLKDGPQSWQSLTELTIWFIVCLVFWITGFYIFSKKSRNQAALLLCLCGITFGLTISGQLAGERAVPTAFWFSVIAATIGPWLLLHFFLVLPEERVRLRTNNLVYLIYVPAVITLVLFPMIGYADGQTLPGFRVIRLLEYGVGFLAVGGVAIFNYLHSTSQKTRQQMKIVLISCLVALIPFMAISILPEIIWEQTVVPVTFSVLLFAFIPLGTGYAVVTQKLMDIDIVIRRGVIYGLITVIMAGILSVAIFFIAANYESIGIPAQILVALVLGGIATVLFGPIKKWIEILLDKLFFKDRYDYRKLIKILSTSLRSLNDFTEISRVIVGVTVQTLNLAGSCLFVKAQSGSLDIGAAQGTFAERDKQNKILALIQGNDGIKFPASASGANPDLAFVIPLIVADKEIGILCLSPKVSRQNFSSDDMYLLQGIASTAAVFLRGAMLIHDVSIRNTFISIASHELRTPMTTIMGYADLLLRRDPPEATRKQWLEEIIDSSQSITSLLDELLNVTRIQAGKVDMKLEKKKISDVLEERLAMIRESTNKHEFVLDVEHELPHVLIDYDKFGQVVWNLLDNAVKYSPKGGRITVSAYNDLRRHRIIVSFADEGIGIGPTDKNLLFTTFHRIQRSETRNIRGSGLGLYIVKEWIEAMGGEIWLESELDKGSTFFIAVPT
jgi:signal transduction histidine kinase